MIEVLVTMLVVGLVAGSLMAIFVSLQRAQVFSDDRAQALASMRLVMERLTKEARQATAIASTSDFDTLEMDTYVLGASKHVVYTVSGSTLTRQQGSDPAVVIQKDLATVSASQPVFTYTYTSTVSDTRLVAITLRVKPPRTPDTTLELKSEVMLRNRR